MEIPMNINLFVKAFFASLIKMSVFAFLILAPFFAHSAPPPAAIPEELHDAFTLNDTIPVINIYRDDSRSHALIYTDELIESFIEEAKANAMKYYGLTDLYLYEALDKYLPHVVGRKVAVLGSEIPWYESILLAYGAHPTTIEYNKIECSYPGIEILTVDEFDANPRTFDAVLSISSFEHDGLGRYGDPLNPIGDLQAMAKTKKMLSNDGLLFLAVPVGKDCLVWNLHRVYGNIRLKMLLQGWKVIDSFGFDPQDFEKEACEGYHQPVFVLKPH
jgi:hypothetical protein